MTIITYGHTGVRDRKRKLSGKVNFTEKKALIYIYPKFILILSSSSAILSIFCRLCPVSFFIVFTLRTKAYSEPGKRKLTPSLFLDYLRRLLKVSMSVSVSVSFSVCITQSLYVSISIVEIAKQCWPNFEFLWFWRW